MYLGLDLGTSGLKALLIDDAQKVVSSATAPLAVNRPQPGWSEQNPNDWIKAAKAAISQLGQDQDLRRILGVGLSGQMHGATLMDASDQVLNPCLLWNDTRAHIEASALDQNPIFRKRTGNIVFPGFTAPKTMWVQNNLPEIFSKVAKVLLPKDYLRLWLTGEYVSDMSDAAGTSWLDTRRRDWSDALLEATGLSRDQMPDLVEGSDISGNMRTSLASELGLSPGTPVAGGGGDNAASAVGVGVLKEGDAFLSLGTSGVLFAATDGFAPAPESALHSFCHAIPGLWHQMGVILSATDSLSWYGRLVGADPKDLTRVLGQLRAPGRTLFLPYLGGERTPHNDAKIRGALLGLEHATDCEAGTRAILEGVGFALYDSLKAMDATGTSLKHVIAVGGGAKSRYWIELIATIFDMPVHIPADGDFGAAFGAARLGMLAAGAANAADLERPPIADTIEPSTGLTAAYADTYARFSESYSAVKDHS
ncbi:MAG: xylulokinase [Pseudomonadota bacterium]